MNEMDITKLLIAFGKIKKGVQKSVNDLLKPYAISSVHTPYLLLLLENEYLTRTALSQLLNVDKAHTTRVIQDLEQKQLVMHDTNARNGHVCLTDQGKKIACLIDHWMKEQRNHFLQTVDNDEFQTFIRVLQNTIHTLEGE